MKRLVLIFMYIFCIFGSKGLLKSMQEKTEHEQIEKSPFDALPVELKHYISTYLSSNVNETYPNKAINPMIKDLLELSTINKAFRRALTSEPNTISQIIKQRFNEDLIDKAVYNELAFGSFLNNIVKYIKIGLFDLDDLARYKKKYPYSWMANIFRKWKNIHYFTNENLEPVYKSLEFLLKNKFIDPNYSYPINEAGQLDSWLSAAVSMNDRKMWNLLVQNGANLQDAINEKAVAKAKTKGWLD